MFDLKQGNCTIRKISPGHLDMMTRRQCLVNKEKLRPNCQNYVKTFCGKIPRNFQIRTKFQVGKVVKLPMNGLRGNRKCC